VPDDHLHPFCSVPIAANDVLEPLPHVSVDTLPQPSCAIPIAAAVLPSAPLAYLYLSVSDIASVPFDVLQPMSHTDLECEQADSVV